MLVVSMMLLVELLAAAAAAAADLELLLVPLCWATCLRLYCLSTALTLHVCGSIACQLLSISDLPPELLCVLPVPLLLLLAHRL
jgi:hypothetical protein